MAEVSNSGTSTENIDQLVNLFANKFKKLKLNEEALPISREERRANLQESIQREELLLNAVDVSMLPDGGEKIKKRIENLNILLAKLDENVAVEVPDLVEEAESESKIKESEEDFVGKRSRETESDGKVPETEEEVVKIDKSVQPETIKGEESKEAQEKGEVENEVKKKTNELDVLIDKVTGRLEGLKFHSKNEQPPPSLEYLQKQEALRMIGQVGRIELEMRKKEGKKSTQQLSLEESLRLCQNRKVLKWREGDEYGRRITNGPSKT